MRSNKFLGENSCYAALKGERCSHYHNFSAFEIQFGLKSYKPARKLVGEHITIHLINRFSQGILSLVSHFYSSLSNSQNCSCCMHSSVVATIFALISRSEYPSLLKTTIWDIFVSKSDDFLPIFKISKCSLYTSNYAEKSIEMNLNRFLVKANHMLVMDRWLIQF